jgi:hypothetical protein
VIGTVGDDILRCNNQVLNGNSMYDQVLDGNSLYHGDIKDLFIMQFINKRKK